VKTDALWRSLERLDAEDRALLELSLRRDVADDALARLLRTDPALIESRRAAALERLASEAAGSRVAVEEALVQHWREGRPAPEAADEAVSPAPADDGRRAGGAEHPTLRGLAILLVVAAAAVAVVLATSGGDDDEPARESRPPAAGGDEAGPLRALRPAAGRLEATGRARLLRREGRWRLRVELSGLPRAEGPYGLWLYRSVSDARLLAGFRGPRLRLSAPLPEGFERFRLVDVSVEPRDGNRNHSGASLLRVELKGLMPPA
jgi:hypothetical protein